jgi:hypothetical protein
MTDNDITVARVPNIGIEHIEISTLTNCRVTRWYVECATCDETLGIALAAEADAVERGKLHQCRPPRGPR